MTIIAEVTQVIRGARQPQKIYRFDKLSEALAWAEDHFKGRVRRDNVYVDTKSRGTIQSGWIFHMRGQGQYWVTFADIISETTREARSIDLGGKP